MKKHPDVELRAIAPGEEPDLLRAHDVRGTPTIVIADAASGRQGVKRGLASGRELDAALTELSKREVSREK